MNVRTQDVRRSLVYYNDFPGFFAVLGQHDPRVRLITFAESLKDNCVRVGWIADESQTGDTRKGCSWRRNEATESHSEVLAAVLQVAALGLHLVGCSGARIGIGVAALEGHQ